MVAEYSTGKGAGKGADKRVSAVLGKVKGFDSELRRLIDEDAESYGKLVNGLKTAKAARDTAAADELYKSAIEPPFLVCEITRKCMDLCMELAQIGNENLITDTAIAAIMLEGAFQSARFNVYINLGCVKDTDYISKAHNVIRGLEEMMPKLKEDILERCEEVIRGAGGAVK
jgi:formiminotetrahydrofolate cyclodeaminase